MTEIDRSTLWVGVSDGTEHLLTSYQDGVEGEEVVPFDQWAALIEREARAVGMEEAATIADGYAIDPKGTLEQEVTASNIARTIRAAANDLERTT